MEEFRSSNMEELKCMVCNKYFSYKRTLKRHQITCGSNESKNCNNVKCPDLSCNKLFTNKKMLKSHIVENHGVQLQNEQKTFVTFNGKCDLLNFYFTFLFFHKYTLIVILYYTINTFRF